MSEADNGGSITERHILYALARRIMRSNKPGQPVIDFVEKKLKVDVPERTRDYLRDPDNPHYIYDLLGVLKSSVLHSFFLQPNKSECVSVTDAVSFANEIGAIPAYAYLGDVGESPTGDKKPEKFEDEYLDELFPELRRLGFRAVTYMPPRNTREQLKRVQALCREHGFMEISGVDINSSRQSFNCPEILDEDFRHLIDATWALIAHEKLSACNPRLGLFSPGNPYQDVQLLERIRKYGELGQKIDRRHPENACSDLQEVLG